jgi:hypothetical protein
LQLLGLCPRLAVWVWRNEGTKAIPVRSVDKGYDWQCIYVFVGIHNFDAFVVDDEREEDSQRRSKKLR